jgi:hypothetical protein
MGERIAFILQAKSTALGGPAMVAREGASKFDDRECTALNLLLPFPFSIGAKREKHIAGAVVCANQY